mmetsp:Transcript_112811/g.319109  ORF Transcript_112811/g.319109 Transcript_112811/m.319109 type:complete len:326 (+) Transcript_112811:219-1196(+)
MLALRPVGQLAGAAVGLAWCLEPEVGVNHFRARCPLRGRDADSGAPHVAPVGAGLAVDQRAVPARVDDDVRVHAEFGSDRFFEALRVVELVDGTVVLRQQPTGVVAARVRFILTLEAEPVQVLCARLPWAHGAKRLVLANVRGEAPHLVERQAEVLERVDELEQVPLPAQPLAVGCVYVNLGRSLAGELLDCVPDARPVGVHGCGIPAGRRRRVCGQHGQAVRLQCHDERQAAVRLQELDKRINKVRLVLTDARRTVLVGGVVVAAAGRGILAADLADLALRVAVAVGQAVQHQHDELWRHLGRSSLDHVLHRARATPRHLGLLV